MQINLIRCYRGDGASSFFLSSRHKDSGEAVDNDFAEKLKGWTLPHALHQEDDTVEYELDATADDSLASAAAAAARAWNYPGAALMFCKDPDSDEFKYDVKKCSGKNTDQYILDVKKVPGKDDCWDTIACAPIYSSTHPYIDRMTVKIEGPPFLNGTEYAWTNDESKVGMLVPGNPGVHYLYLTGTVTHEFGHTGGLWHSRVDGDLMGPLVIENKVAIPRKMTKNDRNAMEANYQD